MSLIKNRIELVLPTKAHHNQIEEYKNKFKNDESVTNYDNMPGCGSLKKLTVDEWIQECADHRVGKNLPDGYVPATQFIALRKSDGKLVGMFQIRHWLTEFLETTGGHIGYSVAPDERGKGYATEMLAMGLLECKKLGIDKVRISHLVENTASEKVITRNGGIYDGEVEYNGNIDAYNDRRFKRYWINI